jgi:uncharacterized protein (TIGR00296 family)
LSSVYSDAEGIFLVKLARQTVEEYVRSKKKPEPPADTPANLRKESGVFVTLNSLAGKYVELRGCIGRPYPSEPLVEATIDSAIDAAVNDFRFGAVAPKELATILVELSILTPPQKLTYPNPVELLDLVQIGRDGLIAGRGRQRGLLLPQVPVEYGWNVKEFLQHTCNKAGLPADSWMDPRTEFMSFQAEIFGEVKPRGEVVRNPQHPRV